MVDWTALQHTFDHLGDLKYLKLAISQKGEQVIGKAALKLLHSEKDILSETEKNGPLARLDILGYIVAGPTSMSKLENGFVLLTVTLCAIWDLQRILQSDNLKH